jgi:Fatty acid desaturase
VLTSRNVRGGWLTDVALGGLNYQIEHHLFPSIPRPNLRCSQPLIEAFCQQRDVPYCQGSLAGSYAQALRHLNAVGRPACPGTATSPAARKAAASLPVVSGLSATGPVPSSRSRRPDLGTVPAVTSGAIPPWRRQERAVFGSRMWVPWGGWAIVS